MLSPTSPPPSVRDHVALPCTRPAIFFHCLEPLVWHRLIFDVVDVDDRGIGFLVRRLEKEEWRGCRGPTLTTQVLAAKS